MSFLTLFPSEEQLPRARDFFFFFRRFLRVNTTVTATGKQCSGQNMSCGIKKTQAQIPLPLS